MKLTGNRLESRDFLLVLRRQNVLTAAEYRRRVAVLEAREKKVQEAAARREEEKEKKARAREAQKERERAAKAAEKKLLKGISSKELIYRTSATGVGESVVRRLFKTLTTISRLLLENGFQRTINPPGGNTDKEYKLFRNQFTVNGDSEPNWVWEDGDTLVFVRPSNIQAKRLYQKFKDGEVHHCVFHPIIQTLEAKLENASEGSAKRYKQRIAALRKLEAEYLEKVGEEQGVSETEMEAVCRMSGLKVTLEDVFKEKVQVWNENGKVGAIRLRNTRENHVEPGIVLSSDAVELSEKEMIEVWNQIKESQDWFRVEGDFKNGLPSKIETLKGSFVVKDNDKEICKEFDKQLGIINYKVNALKFPELNDFLKAGRIVNGWNCDLGQGDATGCADMPKAYSQFKRCIKYSGFLGHVHQFRAGVFDRSFVEKHLGFYGVRCIKGGDWLFEKLGMIEGIETVLFGPELLYFMDCGLEFEIFQGAWGSRFDFEFTPEMLKKGRYTWWSGKLGMEQREVSHTVPGTSEWAAHLMAQGHKVYHWSNDNLITIRKPASQVFTAHHILGGITAYLRIQMMEAMRAFKPEQLVRVVMDGIYYRGEKPSSLDWFGDKELKTTNWSSPWYNDEVIPQFPDMTRILGNSILTGQGGAGKTYSILAQPGFHNVLYVSPTRLLGQDVYTKYSSKWTTYHKLLGIDCRPYVEENRCPAVIVLDEGTQISADWIDQVFEKFPQTLILVIADIDSTGRWYQCRSGDGDSWNEIWNPALHPEVEVIEYTEDRRSLDDELKQLKLQIREAMKSCSAETPLMEMNCWALENLPVSEFKFETGDVCIAGTHKTNKKLLDMGVVSGWYKKGGDVLFVEPSDNGWEKRGSFTIHAYQGKTIDTGKVWIFIDDLFEYAMLYTAVSRVRHFSQLRFVKSSMLH